MHLASIILFLSAQTWSESHFINNLNDSARTPGSDKGKPEELDATSGERGECGVG